MLSVTCKYEFDWPETVYLVGGVLREGSGEFNSLHQFTISCSHIRSPPNPGSPGGDSSAQGAVGGSVSVMVPGVTSH